MKKLIAFTGIASALFFLSCDKITHAPDDSVVKPNTRKILIEDYTGHRCGNCPPAAEVAESLMEKYGDKVVVIAVHAGFFTRTNAEYPTSYTCQTSVDWDGSTGFGVSAAGNPNGMVNRKSYGDNGRIQKETKWASTASLASRDIEYCDMTMGASYNPSTRLLSTSIKTKFRRSYPNNTKLCVVFTEDSVIGPQTDYRVDPDKVDGYRFDHMLRGSINGSWGVDLKSAPIKYQDSVTLAYPGFKLDEKFVDRNVAVIAFVYDAVTKEVLQVERVKIR